MVLYPITIALLGRRGWIFLTIDIFSMGGDSPTVGGLEQLPGYPPGGLGSVDLYPQALPFSKRGCDGAVFDDPNRCLVAVDIRKLSITRKLRS